MPSYYGIRVGVKGEDVRTAAQKCDQRTTAKNKMATKVLRNCMVFSCFYDKFPLQKSSNFLKNCNFKVCRRIYTEDLSRKCIFFAVHS